MIWLLAVIALILLIGIVPTGIFLLCGVGGGFCFIGLVLFGLCIWDFFDEREQARMTKKNRKGTVLKAWDYRDDKPIIW